MMGRAVSDSESIVSLPWRWATVLAAVLCAVLLPYIAKAGDDHAPTRSQTPRLRAATTYTVNVPLLGAQAGDSSYNANNWSVVWFGTISGGHAVGDNAGDLRLIGAQDGVRLRIQLYDRQVTSGDRIRLALNGVQWQVPYSGADDWEISERCDGDECRGWGADALFPWSALGGRPQPGDIWPLRIEFQDVDDQGAGHALPGDAGAESAAWPPQGQGVVHWGLPDTVATSGRHGTQPPVQVLALALSADSMVGGGTDCGADDWPDYFPSWGKRNFGASPYVNVQMQWDIADWPCYSRYYAAWPLVALPRGAKVLSAALELRQFGNPGYGPGYADNGTQDTVVQVFEVDGRWQEATITWDSAPIPRENTARTLVKPLPGDCAPTPYWYCTPGIAYKFDVTEIVQRAQLAKRTWASAALYTAAGQYHSGKYFYSREGAEPPRVEIRYVLPTTP